MACEPHICSGHICTIFPTYLLHRLANNPNAEEHVRQCAHHSLLQTARLHQVRHESCFANISFDDGDNDEGDDGDDNGNPPGRPRSRMRSIIPGFISKRLADSSAASSRDKERAAKQIAAGQQMRAARTAHAQTPVAGGDKDLYRLIYNSKGTSALRENLVRKEGQTTTLDTGEQDVWDSFKKTYDFYFEVLKRDSVDGRGLKLVGNVHYDDEQSPAGYDNAFWDGTQMVFGDGDGKIFGPFTKSVDVIGHELTHGVTQYTANLPYYSQSGALNESMSDVFGIMVKQYALKQTAAQADWIIGEELFLPSVNARGLRSMKAPGTAFKDTPFGSDDQPATMKDYKTLPADDAPENDNGGVHINSGIPNHAFYLAAVAFGGHAWEKAGPIWYKTLLDPKLKAYAQKKANWDKCFKFFADLTATHAAEYGQDAVKIVKKAWADVGL